MEKKEVGERIRKLRIERKLTANALAYQAGISPTYIYELEKGEKSPTVEYLNYICFALGISLEEFFATSRPDHYADKLSLLNEDQKQLLNQFLNSL